ncbi:lipoprotein-anchoring transpeptidase ErfK/SrfK [Mycobacterium sp. URHB0021]
MLLPWSRRVRVISATLGVAALVLLGGDVATTAAQCPAQCRVTAEAQTPSAPAPAPPQAAALRVVPRPQSVDVNPAAPVSVVAFSGTVDDVTMVNDAGKPIPGAVTPDRKGWHPTSQLGYGRTYTMTVSARGPSGMPSRQTSSFTTLSPDYQASVYLDTTAGTLIQDGGTYGIGTVVVARFDEPITDKAATERKLKVTTSPPVTGSWNWIDDQTAHWRPEKYYAPGTSVTVSAELYGTRLGDGLYGEQDERVSFKIGDSHISIADDRTKQVSVFDNGKLVRTMPTSMGMGGTETINGTTLSFWTPSGVYTVMDKANPVIMDSSTFGLPIGSRLGYRETIPYATRISTDGIYLHQLNATVWAQGNTDTSHGCLNLNGDNAEWFFNFSVPGDVVEVRNTGGPPLQLSQNGDWTVPWDQWRQGSALND